MPSKCWNYVDVKCVSCGTEGKICDAIQHRPGSPARLAQEQVNLQQMKTFLFSILCEASLDL